MFSRSSPLITLIVAGILRDDCSRLVAVTTTSDSCVFVASFATSGLASAGGGTGTVCSYGCGEFSAAGADESEGGGAESCAAATQEKASSKVPTVMVFFIRNGTRCAP